MTSTMPSSVTIVVLLSQDSLCSLFDEQGLELLMNFFDGSPHINPLVGRPNAENVPAEPAQDLLSQFVTVTNCCRAMIGHTIALNASEVSLRCV